MTKHFYSILLQLLKDYKINRKCNTDWPWHVFKLDFASILVAGNLSPVWHNYVQYDQ